MSDGFEDKPTDSTPLTNAKPVLDYPFEQPPEPGQSLEILPGVHWMRLPLPFALEHINVWAIKDGDDGWAIVDTGLRSEATAASWRQLFANGSGKGGKGVSRVFVTHMHPDHVGMAGWLARKFDCRLWMSRLEYLTCRLLVSDTGREAPAEAVRFFHRAGWRDESIETYQARFGNFGKHIHALPDSYRRLKDGDEFHIGEHLWRVLIGTGHSPEHACFYCPSLKLLISGDQVLPKISSNVSVHPTEPDADPMADWLDSLARIEREVPDDVLVLPAHGECFRGLHARVRYLAQSQQRSLERLRRSLAEPKRVIDVFGALFARAISETDHGLLGMATGESLACLNYLVQLGEVRCELDADGVAWYQAVGG